MNGLPIFDITESGRVYAKAVDGQIRLTFELDSTEMVIDMEPGAALSLLSSLAGALKEV